MDENNPDKQIINEHYVVRIPSSYGRDIYVCTNCKIRGTKPKAFDDIDSCKK